MAEVLGHSGDLLLVADKGNGVVVDSSLNFVTLAGTVEELLAVHDWNTKTLTTRATPAALELAESALTTLNVSVMTAAGGRRAYTVPDGVKREAERGLEWRKKHKRGGTPVGVNTARTLARGGQIGIEKVRHIAKYFPRHEVDKKGKGWKPGVNEFPSRGRIAWALWGGDAGWRWAKAIVERENNREKALRADGYSMFGDDSTFYTGDRYSDYAAPHGADTNDFKAAYELEEGYAPEFLARVRLDGSGIDRLYKIDADGSVYVWDDGYWDHMGMVNGDIYTYDAALDSDYDDCEKSHVVVDPESAITISARLQANPYRNVSVEDIDADEAAMFSMALPEEDWDMVDRVVVAAGEAIGAPKGDGDGVYTPEERSENAANQVRNASGQFAKQGGRVVVGGDGENGRGNIVSVNGAKQQVTVALDNGNQVTVPGKLTQEEGKFKAAPTTVKGNELPQLDVSGILGQPRTPIDMPNAHLPGTMKPMAPGDVTTLLNDWPTYVKDMRDSFKPFGKDGAAAPATAPAGAEEIKFGRASAPGEKKFNPWTDTKEAKSWEPVGKAIGDAVDGAKKAVGQAAQDLFQPSTPAAKPKPANNNQQGLRDAKNAERKAATVTKTEAARDKAAAGRAPAPAPKPAVPTAEAKKDKAAAGRAPAPDTRNPADAGKFPGAAKAEAAKPTNQDKLREVKNAERKAESEDGKYEVKKGDSLWSIAEANKPDGMTTAEYWNEVMKANPADGFKSGDPNLIYSGEKVNLPGVSPKKPAAPKSNQDKLREVKNAERKAEPAAKSNQDKLREVKNAERKAQTVSQTESKRDAATAGRAPKSETPEKKFNPWTDTKEAKSWEPVGKAIGDAVDGANKAAGQVAKGVGKVVSDVADRVGRAGAEVAKGVGEGVRELTKPAPKSGKAGARKNKK